MLGPPVHPSQAQTSLPELQQYNSFHSYHLPPIISDCPLPHAIAESRRSRCSTGICRNRRLRLKPIRGLPNEAIYAFNKHKIRHLLHSPQTRLPPAERFPATAYKSTKIYLTI